MRLKVSGFGSRDIFLSLRLGKYGIGLKGWGYELLKKHEKEVSMIPSRAHDLNYMKDRLAKCSLIAFVLVGRGSKREY